MSRAALFKESFETMSAAVTLSCLLRARSHSRKPPFERGLFPSGHAVPLIRTCLSPFSTISNSIRSPPLDAPTRCPPLTNFCSGSQRVFIATHHFWVAIHPSARGMVTRMTRPLGSSSTVHCARSPHLHYAQVRVKRCSASWCKDLSEGVPYPSTSHQPLMQRAFIFACQLPLLACARLPYASALETRSTAAGSKTISTATSACLLQATKYFRRVLDMLILMQRRIYFSIL